MDRSRRMKQYAPFLSLLGGFIGGRRPERMVLSGEEWRFVYDTSLRQGVCGLVWSAVRDLKEVGGLPEDLAELWRNAVSVIGRDNGRVNSVVSLQTEAWRRHGIEAVLLKGPESAKMYPEPALRMGGDIDWWFPEEGGWDAALAVVEANGLQWKMDSDGDISYSLGGIVVEHHRSGLVERGPLGELLLRCGHVLHHAMVSGIGMKQICDYFAALNYFEGRYDKAEYSRLLKSSGLLLWESALRNLDPRLLSLVLYDGNMGLDKKFRFSGFMRRAGFFLGICPVKFFLRWSGLFFGRLKRK